MTTATTSSETRIEYILRMSSYLIIFLAVAARLAAYIYNRSLWCDEACLASSVVQRNYLGLFKELDYLQGAPAGYLCAVKSLVLIFGSSEYVLRLLSLVSGLGGVYLFHLVLKIIFKDPRPYVGTAFFSCISNLIYYSTEFKPYMLDAFLTLATLLIFHFAKSRTIPAWIPPVYCAIAVWFSFPVIFTITILCAVWFFQSLRQNEQDIPQIIKIGLATAFSFSIYYFSLYRNLECIYNLKYYEASKISLFPLSSNDFLLLKEAARHYFRIFGKLPGSLALFLTAAGLFQTSLRRTVLGRIFLTEAILIYILAATGLYPIENRFLLFFIPIHVLFIIIVLRKLTVKNGKFALCLFFVFILVNVGALRYFSPGCVYSNEDSRDDYNPIINCLKHSGRSIPLYLFVYTVPNYEYKTNYTAGFSVVKNGVLYGTPYYNLLYKNFSIRPVEKNGIIYGTEYFKYPFTKAYSCDTVIDPAVLKWNIDAILQHKRIYLLLGEYDSGQKNALLDALKEYGAIREVLVSYGTYLLLFEKAGI